MTQAVQVDNCVVRFGRKVAVNGASWTANVGEVTAVIGPNGAGKTSLIETCEGYRRPTSGQVQVFGLDPVTDARALRPRVGVMLQEGGVPSGAHALEALRQMAALYANPLDPADLADVLGLTTVRATYRRMSGGEQQRLKFAIALVGRPELVFLDEPTAGLDIQAKRIVWALIDDLRRAGVAVVLTTHLMDDVERLADQVVILNAGAVIARGTPDQLLSARKGSLGFRATQGLDLSGLATTLPAGITVAENPAGTYQVVGEIDPRVLALVTAWCAENGVMMQDLTTNRRRLEDVVLEITSPASPSPTPDTARSE